MDSENTKTLSSLQFQNFLAFLRILLFDTCFKAACSSIILFDMFVHPLYSLKFLIENFGHSNCSIPLFFVSSKSKWLNDTAAQTHHKMEDISVFAIFANKLQCSPTSFPS